MKHNYEDEIFTIAPHKSGIEAQRPLMVEVEVWDNYNLNGNDIVIYIHIVEMSKEKEKIKLKEIQERTQKSRFIVDSSIRRLEKEGVIKREGKKFELLLKNKSSEKLKGEN